MLMDFLGYDKNGRDDGDSSFIHYSASKSYSNKARSNAHVRDDKLSRPLDELLPLASLQLSIDTVDDQPRPALVEPHICSLAYEDRKLSHYDQRNRMSSEAQFQEGIADMDRPPLNETG